jgi:ABC-type transport system involved in multi-copper enzyme maturation permease subunit
VKTLALLGDSFRETLDCKTFWVLLAVSTLLIGMCLGLSFTPLSPEESLRDIALGFNVVLRLRKGPPIHREFPGVHFEVSQAAVSGQGEYSFRLRIRGAKEFYALLRFWDALEKDLIHTTEDPVPGPETPAELDLQKRYLVSRLREQQLARIFIQPTEPEADAVGYAIRLKPARPELLRGAHRVGILFGLKTFRLPFSEAAIVFWVELLLANLVAGLGGMIFAVIVTASFVPDMLQRGRLDLLLSKPISRPALLVYKYLGGLLYVFLSAVYLIGGCWLALAVRSGRWDPAFLWSIPVLTLSFAVLSSFSIWLGVLTRSALVSILSTLGLWFVSSGVGDLRSAIRTEAALAGLPDWARKGIDAVYLVLPKVSDLKNINGYLLARGSLGREGELVERLEQGAVDWPLVLVSSVAFLAVFLALSCRRFSKRDY